MTDDPTRPRLLGLIGMATRQTFERNTFVRDYAAFVSWDDDRYGRLASTVRPLIPAIMTASSHHVDADDRAGAMVRVQASIAPVFDLLLEEFPASISVEVLEAGYLAPIETFDVDTLDAIAQPAVAIGMVSGLLNKSPKPVAQAVVETKSAFEFIVRHGKAILGMRDRDDFRNKAAFYH